MILKCISGIITINLESKVIFIVINELILIYFISLSNLSRKPYIILLFSHAIKEIGKNVDLSPLFVSREG